MKKIFSLTLLSFIISFNARAQMPTEGTIVLTNGNIVEGIIDINSFINSAMVTLQDGRQLTYHGSMIKEITTVDDCEYEQAYRTYDYRSSGFFDRMEKKIFQVIAEGDITLLRRIFEYDVFDASDEYEIEEWYYLSDNKIRRIRSFRRQVLPLMEDQESEMQLFKDRNNIKNLNKDVNMYLMVSYYNRLSKLAVVSINK